uniref:Ig-like domain-containing protein n=1 Tax=Mesocestoides corti TaxID=53468 RepID=A0A5K3F4A4_MESCO
MNPSPVFPACTHLPSHLLWFDESTAVTPPLPPSTSPLCQLSVFSSGQVLLQSAAHLFL